MRYINRKANERRHHDTIRTVCPGPFFGGKPKDTLYGRINDAAGLQFAGSADGAFPFLPVDG